MNKQSSPHWLPIFLCALAFLGHPASAALLLDMPFNDPNTAATSGASTVGGMVFAYQTSTGGSTALQTGTGVSGLADDFSLNLTSATGMGSAGQGPIARYARNTGTAIAAQTSLTVAGWFQTDGTTQIGNGARLLEFGNLSVRGGAEAGTLDFVVGTSPNVASTASYTATQEWIFFAVTFDGTASIDNVKFYIGGLDSSVSLVSTLTVPETEWGGWSNTDASGSIRIGNAGSTPYSRPFDGYLDNIQLYGEMSGSDGALDLTQLEAVRLSAIPEPHTWGLLILGAVTIMTFRRRRAEG